MSDPVEDSRPARGVKTVRLCPYRKAGEIHERRSDLCSCGRAWPLKRVRLKFSGGDEADRFAAQDAIEAKVNSESSEVFWNLTLTAVRPGAWILMEASPEEMDDREAASGTAHFTRSIISALEGARIQIEQA